MQSNLPHPFSELWWAVTLAWPALIFYLSTQAFTPDSSKLCWPVRSTFSTSAFQQVRSVFFMPCCVSWPILQNRPSSPCFFRVFLVNKANRSGGQRQAVICILVAVGYSLTDEYHQLHIPGRHASLLDCALDTFGASLALLVAYTRKRLSLLRSTRTST
jgi:hypothetical protein